MNDTTTSDTTREGGFILSDAPKCNVVGAYIIAGYAFIIAVYLGSCVYTRWRQSRGKVPEVDSGKFRLAAATGRVDVMIGIKRALNDVFDIDCSVFGFTALHAAVCQGEVGAVLWLLQNGAGVDKVKDDGWQYTALHYAAMRGNLEIAQILFAYGAGLDRENFLGETATQMASNMGHRQVSMHLSSFASGVWPRSGAEKSAIDSRRLSSMTGDGKHSEVGDGSGTMEAMETLRRELRDQYDGCYFEKRVDPVTKVTKWDKKVGQVFEVCTSEFEEYMKRGNEGYGTPGTVPGRYLKGFRRIAVVYLVVSFLYLVWRALRSLNPGWWYFYSIPFFMIELTGWTLGLCFVYSLYYQIDRPSRSVTRMIPEEEFPKTDVYICRYSEPVEILEATTVAALNMDYPGDKLSVYVLDDGRSDEVRSMCTRLRYQLKYMGRRANLFYVGRSKKQGVPHHAKAGNINNALLMHSPEDTQYILVLDCDMIIHPTFLHRTLSHFYVEAEDGGWRQKQFVGLLQTPQDFWNVDSEDPMVHCARFFYGPMLQGRDGAGACPCCGTGVIFQRSTLVSVGGQSYGSITEDCNTSMQLLSSGFANMFLNERLVYGMAPEDLPGVFQQRARWAMGALQILYRDNPLRKRGLTMSQSFLFFEIGAHHYLAIGTALATVVPLVYVYVEASPVIVEYLWEFCIVFSVFFLTNRVMIWWAHRGCSSGGTLELWRGGQMWIWMCPSHIKAIFKTFLAETNLFGCLGNFTLTFKVTDKGDKDQTSFWESFAFASPFVVYLLAVLGSTIYFIVMAIVNHYSTWSILMTLTAIAWSIYISLCIWPPVSVMIPRVETEHGWKISWDTAIDESKLMVDEKKRVVRRPKKRSKASAAQVSKMNGVASSKPALGRTPGSIIGNAVKEMEEGAMAFDFSGLTKRARDTYRPDMPNLGVDQVESPDSSQDADFFSPFAAREESQSESAEMQRQGSNARGSGEGSGSEPMLGLVRSRIQQFGSRIASNLSHVMPRVSLSQKASQMNIGRVALPKKTAQGIAGSAFTSMILPEPSRVKFDRTMSAEVGLAEGDTRRDVRHLSLQSLVSQDSLRRSLMLLEAATRSGLSDAAAARRLVMQHSRMASHFQSKGNSVLPVSPANNSFVDALHRSVIVEEGEMPGGEQRHHVLSKFGSVATSSSTSSLDFESPFADKPDTNSAADVSIQGNSGDMPSVGSPLFTNPSDVESGVAVSSETMSGTLNSDPKSIQRRNFVITKDGRVIVSGQEVGLNALLGQVVNEMKFSSGPVGTLDLTSPMAENRAADFFSDVDHSRISRAPGMSTGQDTSPAGKTKMTGTSRIKPFPLVSFGSEAYGATAQGSKNLQMYGESLLRSMSMSYRENLTLDSQKVVDLQRRMIQSSIIMGEMATETLGKRIANQPGSIMISSIFTQLSQMQPSLLQKQGLVLPIIPDDVFEHTIAAKPSFEFRVLPDKTITFFTVNITIMAGVCAGGIVSIFFQSGT